MGEIPDEPVDTFSDQLDRTVSLATDVNGFLDVDFDNSALKRRALTGAGATAVTQGLKFILKFGSAVALGRGKAACFGFAIRDVGRRLTPQAKPRELPHSANQLAEMIGRVPLKELVRETTDVIEKLCIEAALELTGDNRASAAEVLGLSRQSLYVKLRRYGLAEPGIEEDA